MKSWRLNLLNPSIHPSQRKITDPSIHQFKAIYSVEVITEYTWQNIGYFAFKIKYVFPIYVYVCVCIFKWPSLPETVFVLK